MFLKLAGLTVFKSEVTHFTDQWKPTVDEPKVGSILYSELLGDVMEHSGVYIGNGKIIELNNQGRIVEVTPEEFISGGTGLNIYVSAQKGVAVGSSLIAERAIRFMNDHSFRNYNILFDNCHIFTSSCMLDDPDNANSFLWTLKDLAKTALGADQWLVWKNASKYEVPKETVHFTHQDLLKTKKKLDDCKKVDREYWNEIKSYTKRIWELHDNAPHTWYFHSESREENWQRALDQLEQENMIAERKSKDLLDEMKMLEDKIAEIEEYLSQEGNCTN